MSLVRQRHTLVTFYLSKYCNQHHFTLQKLFCLANSRNFSTILYCISSRFRNRSRARFTCTVLQFVIVNMICSKIIRNIQFVFHDSLKFSIFVHRVYCNLVSSVRKGSKINVQYVLILRFSTTRNVKASVLTKFSVESIE